VRIFARQEINHTPLARRHILKFGAAAAAGLALAPRAEAATPKAPPKPQNVLSPHAALKRLLEGNARYIEGVARRHDFKHEREVLSGGQNPFAAVLSCADSRIAPEYCFDVALNFDKLKSATPILKAAADDRTIRVVGGVYELKTGKVQLLA
jgi:hypothetical protein